MILLSVRATKLLLFVVSTAMILKRFHKQLSKRGAACLGALMILLALTANFAAGKVPALTDTVTLTALGEKQKEAGAEEILLTGYMVDGENFSAGKALQVMDGKWFWSGESYLWRIETDPRQPAGTTRTVAIKVPVGWERSLEFCSDMWRGKVEITANGTKQIPGLTLLGWHMRQSRAGVGGCKTSYITRASWQIWKKGQALSLQMCLNTAGMTSMISTG